MDRKKTMIVFLFFIIAFAIAGWFVGYYNHKSNDNLPQLAAVAEMEEASINSLLPGYDLEQLMDVWGEPDEMEGNFAVWKLDRSNLELVVGFNNKGKIMVCGLQKNDIN